MAEARDAAVERGDRQGRAVRRGHRPDARRGAHPARGTRPRAAGGVPALRELRTTADQRADPGRGGRSVTVRVVWSCREPIRHGGAAVLDSGAARRVRRRGCRRPRRHEEATRAHGNDERPEERHGAQHRRPALAVIEFQHVKPGKGPAVRAHQAEERRVRQDRRQDLQRRHQGRDRQRRQAHDAVPLQRRHVLRLHGHRRPTTSSRSRPRSSATPRTSCSRTRRRSSPPTRAACSTSSCRRRSSSRSPTPSPACRATAPPAAPSRPRSRPATRSRCRCSSPPARRSRSTPATRPTWAASSPDRPHLMARPARKARKRALDILYAAELRGE